MKLEFEIRPGSGIGPIDLGMGRESAIERIGLAPNSFKKTPLSEHPTDSFYSAGFQIFYAGCAPQVDSIELSRDCGFEAVIGGVNILNMPISEALAKIESVTGLKPETDDDGYSYEIAKVGLWVWRESTDSRYFDTIGIGAVST